MFMGQPGSGKTHLSLSIANVLMDKGVGVVYMGYRDVITQIKQNIMDEVYYNKVMNRYKNAKVLLIDDLFKGSISKSDINIMFELINHRYFNKLPVIVSTELSIENLVNIDEALGSRLIEMSKKIAKSRGYRGIYTQGQDDNLGACLFYLNNGFIIGGLDTQVYAGTSQEGKKDILFYLDADKPSSEKK